MQKPENLPKTAGVYVLLHEGKRVAYVGKCANIRHRAYVWEYNFRLLAMNPDHKMPIRDFPKDTLEHDWQFGGVPGVEDKPLRQALAEQGYRILNDKTRIRDLIEYNGRSMTLSEHAKLAGVPYTKAYYRYRAGKPMEEVLRNEQDVREQNGRDAGE